MRHRNSGRNLSRTSSHRHAMLRNMTVSLFRHETITTTLPKAKELRRVAEPLITLGKTSSLSNRRLAYMRLRDREIVGKLFDDLGVRFKDRPGGYLRILKSGYRHGDAAPMAFVQLVDTNPVAPTAGESKTADDTSSKKAKSPKKSKTESASETTEAQEAAPKAKKKTTKKKAVKKSAKKKKAAK